MSSGSIGPKLICVAGAAVFFLYLLKGLRTGYMKVGYGVSISRKEEPDGFWIVAAFNVLFIFGCLLGAAFV